MDIDNDTYLTGDIVNYCNEEVRKSGLGDRITFQKIRVNYKDIKNINQKIFKKYPTMDLVVWIASRKFKGNIVPINFVYKNTRDNLIASIVHHQMSSLVSIEKTFDFHKDTFLVDLNLEKQNIIEFSLFIVAICTTIFRGNKDGIFIFEKLINKIKERNGVLKKGVSDKLGLLYMIAGSDFLIKEKFPDALENYEKGYKLIPKNRDLLAGYALAQFLNGFEEEAEKTATILLEKNNDFPVAHLDIAFFRIKRKRYKNALKHYKIYKKYNPNMFLTLDAINFFSKRIDESPLELGYLFARGFLKRVLDKKPELAKVGESDYVEDFKTFIRRGKDKDEYKDLIITAQRYLQNFSTKIDKVHR